MKPMLAATCNSLNSIQLPVLCSPKLDGIRVLVLEGVAYSRNMKPIPNEYVQTLAAGVHGIDGELICGPPTAPDVFRRTSSAVMSTSSPDEENVKFYLFDSIDADMHEEPFETRLDSLQFLMETPYFVPVEHHWARSVEQLEELEQLYLAQGYEGMMVRDPEGTYKQGRSTAREGGLLKVKRFADAEARVIGFEEQMHNANEATKDELGRTKRSSAKAGKRATGKLGALICTFNGIEFNIGTGFDDRMREELWAGRKGLVGQLVKFKYFPTGAKERPRFPVFIGFRHEGDLS